MRLLPVTRAVALLLTAAALAIPAGAIGAGPATAAMRVSVTVVTSCSVESELARINVRCSRGVAAPVRVTPPAGVAAPGERAVSGLNVAIPIRTVQKIDRPAEEVRYAVVQLNF